MSLHTNDSRARNKADVQQRDVAFARSAPTYGRWVSWIVVLVIATNLLWLVATNPNFEWHVVLQWFTEGSVLKGLQVTLGLTVISMILGTLLGLLLAVWRLSENKLLSGISGLYIWFFRGTPLLVQLIFGTTCRRCFQRYRSLYPGQRSLLPAGTRTILLHR